MNKPLRRIAIFCGLLVLTLLVRDNWLQYVQADDLKEDEHNRRVAIERYATPRGDIIVDGKAITGHATTEGDFKYKRTYKDGAMWAPVTGYVSQAYGATQLEAIDDGILTGNDDRLFFRNTLDMITGKKREGGNVVTTLNAAAQKAAYDGLKKQGGKGAVVAIEPSTGKILSMASYPSYDPSAIAGGGEADGEAWNRLQKKNNPDDPMLNRALREVYPPGSTFKVLTAAAALEHGLYDSADGKTDSPLPWTMPGTTTELPNEGDLPCEDASLREALRVSCNTVFGKIGADLGNDEMLETAKKFGFTEEQFVPVRSSASVFSDDMNASQTALSAIGQYNTAATPLQMAMVTSAIANNGTLMKPYMVDELQAPNLDTIEKTDPEKMSEPLSADNAQILQDMMETVVEDGTGTNAKIDGVTVGGKTGTAQHGVDNSENPYAWFISYAKGEDGSSPVAVAVVVEDENANRDDISGGGLAAPIARNVMEAVLESKK
ncbi:MULTISPECIES: peptidoglycan D,D-transpeptidase FtsI family protein [Streptomyces]|uniref:Peptidoglycan D,D-transpeptidase FtsI family protein n=1 Tax=Streptomyces rochei TaxID=1928 RepID=A0ABW7E8N4_STRRO|nr:MULTISPECIES: penicillin-binding protein 2 [Streptomyces]WDI19442.1 penicillin-binding protein 2 [Streptomyces enissocaesilis]GGY56539.1 penicillin-binding protein [Streptomyces geysiriensis]MBQ0881175.1 penicillin-binding protein 2 [Streptomyces sp. RT42]MBU8550779.1 penicillin-binding protein 2 [Streptomyces sp. Osf17]MBU8557560.1 penicillin-binding protein 2 [Streptomyces sp. Babs14]